MDERVLERLDKIAKRRGWGEEQKQAILSRIEDKQADDADWTEEARGLAAIPAESLTLGILGDEVRAAGRAAIQVGMDSLTGSDQAGSFSEEYELALEDERRVERETYRDMPVASYGLGIGFGIIPAGKVSAAAGLGKTFTSGAARQGGAAAAEAGVYGFLEGEGGVEDRIENAGRSAALGAGLGSVVGGVGGRIAGNSAKAEAKRAVAIEQEAKRVEQLRQGEGLSEEINTRMREKALAHLNETGQELADLPYMQALRDTAEEIGVPLKRARQSDLEFFEGKGVDDLIQKVDDYVPGLISREQVGWATDFWRNNIQPVVRKAETVVGKSFAGRMQRYATRLAQASDETTGFFKQKPVQAFGRAMRGPESGEMRAALLNMSNLKLPQEARAAQLAKLKRLLNEAGGEEAVNGFHEVQKRLYQEQQRQTKFVNGYMKPDLLYWPAAPKNSMKSLKGPDATSRLKQNNLMVQERGIVNADQAYRFFENPVIHADNWIRQSRGVSEMMNVFGLKNIRGRDGIKWREAGKTPTDEQLSKAGEKAREQIMGGEYAFKQLKDRLIAEGADEATADHANTLMRAVAVDGTKGPNAVISNFRKAAYAGTIGNPYSAVLNLGDTFNSIVNFGAANTAKSLARQFRAKGMEVTVDDIGLMNQTTGEFIRDGVGKWQQRFDRWSDLAFKISGFRGADRLGKNTAIGAALRNNRSLAVNEKAFRDRWEGVFTPREVTQLRADVLKGEKSQLVKELAAAELSRMQPTDMASLPQWFLEHPNGRVLYMLRTFGLKQIQQMDDLIVQQWKKGEKKEAIKNALAFTAITGGGNALLQEARQTLKGDAPNLSLNPEDQGLGYRFADHMLGAASANTVSMYTLGRSTNERNPVHLIGGALPPFGMVVAPIIDAAQIADAEDVDMKEALADSEILGWLPWGRLVKDWMKDD